MKLLCFVMGNVWLIIALVLLIGKAWMRFRSRCTRSSKPVHCTIRLNTTDL